MPLTIPESAWPVTRMPPRHPSWPSIWLVVPWICKSFSLVSTAYNLNLPTGAVSFSLTFCSFEKCGVAEWHAEIPSLTVVLHAWQKQNFSTFREDWNTSNTSTLICQFLLWLQNFERKKHQSTDTAEHCCSEIAPWGLKELFRLFQCERFQNAKCRCQCQMTCQNVALLSPKDGCCIARHGWVYPKSSHEWLALGQRAKDLWMSKQKLRPQRQPCDMLQSCCTNCTNAEFFPRSFLPFCGETMTFFEFGHHFDRHLPSHVWHDLAPPGPTIQTIEPLCALHLV